MSFLVEELFDLTVSAFKVFHRTLQLTEERLPSWTAFQPYSLMYHLPLTSCDSRELKNHDEVHDDDVCWPGKDWNENVSFGAKKET